MKLKNLSISLLILLLININTVSSLNKIQIGDEWKYENNDIIYTEKAIENFVQGDSAYTKVSTNRPFPFEFYKYTKTFSNLFDGVFSINIELGDGFMFLTQGGGLPVYHNYRLRGNISFTTSNYSYFSQFNEEPINGTTIPQLNWYIDGVFENGLQITTPTRYRVSQHRQLGNNEYWGSVSFSYNYLMTSFQNNEYIMQYEDMRIGFGLNDYNQTDQYGNPSDRFSLSYNPLNGETALSIVENGTTHIYIEGIENDISDMTVFAYQISLDDNHQVPIIIEQVEQNNTIQTYILTESGNETTTDTNIETVTETITEMINNSNSPSVLGVNVFIIMITIIFINRLKNYR